MTNSEQAIREKAINIFADIFTAGGESHEVGGQSFDQLQQSGYIDRKITDLTALISEHYVSKEFVEWKDKKDLRYSSLHNRYYSDTDNGMREFTLDELFNYWVNNKK